MIVVSKAFLVIVVSKAFLVAVVARAFLVAVVARANLRRRTADFRGPASSQLYISGGVHRGEKVESCNHS